MTVESSLTEVASSVIDRRRSEEKISPSWVAGEVMVIIDPDRRSPEVVYFGCHLQVRQYARQLLRARFGPDTPAGLPQHELFPDLQWRYPKAGSAQTEEPEYLLLEAMSTEDIDYNVNRLRSEANAKLHHADALEAYGKSRGPNLFNH